MKLCISLSNSIIADLLDNNAKVYNSICKSCSVQLNLQLYNDINTYRNEDLIMVNEDSQRFLEISGDSRSVSKTILMIINLSFPAQVKEESDNEINNTYSEREFEFQASSTLSKPSVLAQNTDNRSDHELEDSESSSSSLGLLNMVYLTISRLAFVS